VGEAAWQLRRDDRQALAAVRQGRPPALPGSISRFGTDAAPGELSAVRLAASTESISFTLARGPSDECATLVVETIGACPLPRVVRLPHIPRARLLADALNAPRRDGIYPAALAVAARLAG
jgi:hypothetical protein